VFHIDVAKVDPDIAHVAVTIHVCCKSLFKMFHLFETHVAIAISGCCIYIAMTMLQARVLKCFVYSDVCCNCFI
jgi:hypothetical protein